MQLSIETKNGGGVRTLLFRELKSSHLTRITQIHIFHNTHSQLE